MDRGAGPWALGRVGRRTGPWVVRFGRGPLVWVVGRGAGSWAIVLCHGQ